jgi:hypothetical protein
VTISDFSANAFLAAQMLYIYSQGVIYQLKSMNISRKAPKEAGKLSQYQVAK